MEDLITTDHPDTGSALLTHIMYLARYDVDRRALQKDMRGLQALWIMMLF